jgi:hypothetical protein
MKGLSRPKEKPNINQIGDEFLLRCSGCGDELIFSYISVFTNNYL